MTEEAAPATDCVGSGGDDRPGPPSGSKLDRGIAAMLKRDAAGLVPAVIQEEQTGEVLMLGWMDDEALRRTLSSGRTTFFSRSRNAYWVKGETSGNRQSVREVRLDCDGDTLLVKVHQEGPACHTGDRTCFDARVLSAEPVMHSRDPGVAPGMDSGGSPAGARGMDTGGGPAGAPGMDIGGGPGVVPRVDTA